MYRYIVTLYPQIALLTTPSFAPRDVMLHLAYLVYILHYSINTKMYGYSIAGRLTLRRCFPITSVLPLNDDTMLYKANVPMITAPNLPR